MTSSKKLWLGAMLLSVPIFWLVVLAAMIRHFEG
jgi:hypothetical protein